MLAPPLYCALCSGRCLTPRIDLPLPAPRPGGLSFTPETESSNPSPRPDPPTWESRWFVLQVSEGLIKPNLNVHAQSEPNSPLHPLSVPSTPNTAIGNTFMHTNKRSVPIHQYCLDCVLTTIRRSMYNNGFSHEENMILAWSIPKWTGHGEWANPLELKSPVSPMGMGFVAGRVGSAYWSGTESQRARWDRNVEGSHLLSADFVSPEDIGKPSPCPPLSPASSPHQTSRLLALPEHVLAHIALDLLNIPQIPDDTNINSTSRLLPVNDITDLLSFLRTSADLRHLALPSWLWKRVLFDSVSRFRLSLLSRWRANPTGVGSTMQLAIALDQAFAEPVEKALGELERDERTPDSKEESSERGGVAHNLTARDVFHWWAYSEGWRSRRRVWYCVVHACATARDADWW